MKKFTYIDYRTKRTLFECEASDIFIADERFFRATGIHAIAANYVGCTIRDIKPTRTLWKRLRRLVPIWGKI